MNLAIELQTVTAAEIAASYRAANLRRLRPGYSLLTALNTPCVERALRRARAAPASHRPPPRHQPTGGNQPCQSL